MLLDPKIVFVYGVSFAAADCVSWSFMWMSYFCVWVLLCALGLVVCHQSAHFGQSLLHHLEFGCNLVFSWLLIYILIHHLDLDHNMVASYFFKCCIP